MINPIKIIKAEEYVLENGKPKQEQIWDSIAQPWRTYVVKKIPVVEEFLKGKKGRVVDLGCGSGRNIIAGKEIEYYGVDFSERQLKFAEKYMKKGRIKGKLFKSRIDRLPFDFKDNMFDYGLFIGSLHCLESSDERLNALREFYRVLKKGSEGLISVWNSSDKRFDKVGNKGGIYMSWLEDGKPYMRYYYLYKKREFLDLLCQVGFKVLEFYSSREVDRFSKKNWVVKVGKIQNCNLLKKVTKRKV